MATSKNAAKNDQVALLSDEIYREEAKDAIVLGEFDAIAIQRDWEDGFCRIRDNWVLPIIIRPFVGRDPGLHIGKNPVFVLDILTQTLIKWSDKNRRRGSTHVAFAVLRHINSVTELYFFAWVRPES